MQIVPSVTFIVLVLEIANCLADESYDCEANEEQISRINIDECFVVMPTFFEKDTLLKCYEKVNIRPHDASNRISLSWIKNVEVTGCLISSEQRLNGSANLSSALFDFLKSKNIELFEEVLGSSIDTCSGNMSETRIHRLEFYQAQALKTKDGGASSSPMGSFLLECIYAEMLNYIMNITRQMKPDYCFQFITHVTECGTW